MKFGGGFDHDGYAWRYWWSVVRLSVRTWGSEDGPIAILVHGGGHSSESWRELGPWLADRGWRVIAPDIRGHGRSEAQSPLPSPLLPALVDDIAETIDGLVSPSAELGVLVGHSMGAALALEYAVRYPSRVRRLVIEDPPGPQSMDISAFSALLLRRLEASPQQVPDPRVIQAICEELVSVDMIGLAGRCVTSSLLVFARDSLAAPSDAVFQLAEHSTILGEERAKFRMALHASDAVELPCGHDVHLKEFAKFSHTLENWLHCHA